MDISRADELMEVSDAPVVAPIEPLARGPTKKEYAPILPFWHVLRFGLDADRPPRGEPIALPYHPAVGYVRIIYLAISLNAVVDTVGIFGLLRSFGMHAYASAFVACVTAAVFVAMAATLVQKELRRPSFAPGFLLRSLPIFALAAAGGLFLIYDSAGAPIPAIDGFPTEFLGSLGTALSCIALSAAVLHTLVAAYGGDAAVFMAGRLGLMLLVGYMVADPLQHLMFAKEIHAEYTLLLKERAAREQSEASKAAIKRNADEAEACRQLCAQKRKDWECSRLIEVAHGALATEEENGASSDRTSLKNSAAYCSEALSVLNGPIPTRHGRGDTFNAHLQRENVAQERTSDLKKELDACESPCESPASGIMVGSSSEVVPTASVDPDADPPPIAAAEAMGRLIEKSKGSSAGAALIKRKLLVAWAAALVVPVVVFLMKLTAGDRLEPYLRARWAGRTAP